MTLKNKAKKGSPVDKPTAASRAAVTAATLAALLAAAKPAGLEPAVLSLARGSHRGQLSLVRLSKLRERLGGRVEWSYLARLLNDIDRLVIQLGEWKAASDVLTVPVPALEHLIAATHSRSLELRKSERGAIAEVAQRLEEQAAEETWGRKKGLALEELSERVCRLEAELAALAQKREMSDENPTASAHG